MQEILVDCMKGYYFVRREVLCDNLIQFGILMKLVRLIKTCLNETCIRVQVGKHMSDVFPINTFAASYLNTQGLNNSRLKSPASTLVDLTFQSRALRSFSLNQLRKLSL